MTARQLLAHYAAQQSRPFATGMADLPARFLPQQASGLDIRVNVSTTGPEPGNWLIAIRESACDVLVGSVPEPTVRLYTDSVIGHWILSGRLSLDEAVLGGLLHFDGDPAHLETLRRCFQFGQAHDN